MTDRTVIAEAGNVLPAALASLKRLGYTISISRDGTSFEASTATLKVIAEDPLALLGLVKLHELRGGIWHPSDVEVNDFLSFHDKLRTHYHERADVWVDHGVVMLKCVTSGGDPIEMNEEEARAFAARLHEAITEAEKT